MLHVSRTVFRYEAVKRQDEDSLGTRIIELACNSGHAGYRMVTHILRNEGQKVNHKCVERIWREEGLKLPKKQSKKRRLWLTDGSCVRLRPEHRNHVWSYDFVEDLALDGRRMRFLNIIDEAERECLASIPKRNRKTEDVIEVLSDLMITRGCPEYIRSDNGSEFTAKIFRKWLSDIGVITSYIEPGSPWENGYCEIFNAKMRQEFLNEEQFGRLYEAKVLALR